MSATCSRADLSGTQTYVVEMLTAVAPFCCGAGGTDAMAQAKLQPGRQCRVVCLANVQLALDQLSAAGLDLSVRAACHNMAAPLRPCRATVAEYVYITRFMHQNHRQSLACA